MDRTFRFRQSLASRLFRIAGVAALGCPVAWAAGCGGNVVVDPSGAGGAEPTTSSTSTGASTGTTSSTSSGVPTGDIECFAWDSASPCPAADGVLPLLQENDCVTDGNYTAAVLSGPYPQNGQCCYEVELEPCAVPGRPFLVDDLPLTAEVRSGADAGWTAEGLAPSIDTLTPAERQALAEAWARDGLLEHASIASFARFSLDLLAAGAPAELVEAAHRAALDEARHARLCFTLAGAYGGAPAAPGPFPFGGATPVASRLADLAAAAAKEGCVGETIAAILAAEQLAGATDPAVRQALATIAADEARHAELAFRAVAWALRAGGAEVRAAVAAAFDEAARSVPRTAGGGEDARGVLAAHGRLHPDAGRAAAARALCDIVLPCARALIHTPERDDFGFRPSSLSA